MTCASASDCWAVGSVDILGGEKGDYNVTLIERWDGTNWSIVSSPNAYALDSYLRSVTCTSASDCWAVGVSDTDTGGNQTLIEHWDGTAWSIATSPDLGSTLGGVTCTSASDCWAVGDTEVNDYGQTFIKHWDGTSWAVVPSPNTSPQQSNGLDVVTCAAASDCWAVGGYANFHTGIPYQTLIERWDGASWSIVASPNTSTAKRNQLYGIACALASDCWAVGAYDNGSSPVQDQTLIEQWNGETWSIVSSPPYNTTPSNGLQGVTCTSTAECWTVGNYYTGVDYVFQTLIEEYAPTIPPLTSAVSRKVHGSAGTFDITLPITGDPGIECRNPGATGTPGFDYKIVLSFVNNLTSCGTASAGSLSSGPGPNQCTVDLTGVANQQYLTIELDSVLDAKKNTGNVSATMGLLIGDTTADGSVNAGDIAQTKSTSGQTVDQTNFRTDVTVDGNLNSGDIGLVKSESGTGLP